MPIIDGGEAASLSEMIPKLSAPDIELLSHLEATKVIYDKSKKNASGTHQNFQGSFGSAAILLFPKDQSLKLVRAVLQQEDITLDDLSNMEQEAITEIGNLFNQEI